MPISCPEIRDSTSLSKKIWVLPFSEGMQTDRALFIKGANKLGQVDKRTFCGTIKDVYETMAVCEWITHSIDSSYSKIDLTLNVSVPL